MKHTKEDYIKAAQNSFSIAQMCVELGVKPIGGNYQTIKNKIKEYNIDISHFTGRAWNQGKRYRIINKPKSLEEILKENSPYQSFKLKERLLELKADNVIPVFVPVENKHCSRCRVELPTAKLNKLKAEGTIVCEYDGKAFEVKFFDANGDTLDVVTTPTELLELVEEYQG